MSDQPEIPMPDDDREARAMMRLSRSPDWEMPPGIEKSIPLMLYQILVDQVEVVHPTTGVKRKRYRYSPRTRLMASRRLQEMQRDNVRRETDGAPQVHLHAEMSIDQIRQERLSDPNYVEYLRDRERHLDARDVREAGEPGPLVSGSALGEDRPSDHGGGHGAGAEAGLDHDAAAAREKRTD